MVHSTEELAEFAHEVRRDTLARIFTQTVPTFHGREEMRESETAYWRRIMNTDYSDLPTEEKQDLRYKVSQLEEL